MGERPKKGSKNRLVRNTVLGATAGALALGTVAACAFSGGNELLYVPPIVRSSDLPASSTLESSLPADVIRKLDLEGLAKRPATLYRIPSDIPTSVYNFNPDIPVNHSALAQIYGMFSKAKFPDLVEGYKQGRQSEEVIDLSGSFFFPHKYASNKPDIVGLSLHPNTDLTHSRVIMILDAGKKPAWADDAAVTFHLPGGEVQKKKAIHVTAIDPDAIKEWKGDPTENLHRTFMTEACQGSVFVMAAIAQRPASSYTTEELARISQEAVCNGLGAAYARRVSGQPWRSVSAELSQTYVRVPGLGDIKTFPVTEKVYDLLPSTPVVSYRK